MIRSKGLLSDGNQIDVDLMDLFVIYWEKIFPKCPSAMHSINEWALTDVFNPEM
jgi:hypothetical protein